MKLVVTKIERETNEAVSIYFKNGTFFNKLKYKPGQFLTLYVPVNGKIEKRMYSFSCNPFTDKELKITVKEVKNGLVSRYLCNEVKIGDTFEVDKPQGSFFIQPHKNAQKQYILFAGGSGITPIFSIVKSVLIKEPKSKILLIYANKDKDSIIFHDEINELLNKYSSTFKTEHILYNNKITKENYHLGLASNELFLKIFYKHGLSFENNIYMICGPFGYMEKTKEILGLNKVQKNQIAVEVFKSHEINVFGKDSISDVEIIFDGETHQIKVPGNKSILSVAMSNNIALPYSCGSGMCSTCKVTLVKGEVEMAEVHFLEQSEVDNGKILTCISYPKSKKVSIEIIKKTNVKLKIESSRKRQFIGGIIGLSLGILIFFFLSLDSSKEYISLGPMNTGHKEVSCVACHADAKGNLSQQLQSNFMFTIGIRKEGVDFGTKDVVANNCLICHDRPNDRHPTYRFLEPKFKEAIKHINATTCITCHTEHKGERVTIKTVNMNYCMNCHKELKVKDDPLDISHKELIDKKQWFTCIQCHDFHGNHTYKVAKKLKDTIPMTMIQAYLKGGKDPFGNVKKYKGLSHSEWLEKIKK
jgi:ferredoxin-NADP reductase